MSERKRYLFLSLRQWLTGSGLALIPALGLLPWYYWISYWIGAVLFVVSLTVYHMVFASRVVVPFPHVAILISALQYVLAAWLAVYNPHDNPLYNIGADTPTYLSYAGPVIIAVWAGWLASLSKLRTAALRQTEVDPKLLLELDVLLLIGLAASALGRFVDIPSLAFFFVLLANLRYLAVFGRMVTRSPGWTWRLAIVLTAEVVFAVDIAMFHPLLLWSCWTGALWIFCFRPRPRLVVAAALLGLLLLPALQQAKWRIRGGSDYDIIEGPETDVVSDSMTKTVSWVSFLGTSLVSTVTLDLDQSFIAETLVRYNQGWIVNRVMYYVPESEPFALGETIQTAVVAAVVPRIIAENKIKSGGREYMARFAGMELNETTAMNLGYVGEMYANFGLFGGVIGSGLYALVFGLLFRWFCSRAFVNPLWWATIPFVFFSVLKAEDGIADAIGWTTKSCFVLAGLYFVMPAFRSGLTRHTVPPRVLATDSLQLAQREPLLAR